MEQEERLLIWLTLPACIGMGALAVAVFGMAALQVIPPAGTDAHSRAYNEWLEKYQAIELVCGKGQRNQECWNAYQLPPRAD